MMRTRFFVGLIAVFAASFGVASDTRIADALRAKYPDGIPWHVTFFDSHGKSLGVLDMLITNARGRSCLGEIDTDGVRVDFLNKDQLSHDLWVTSYGVARIDGIKIAVDLTGGLCDAYLLMTGELNADGSSQGHLSKLNLAGGKNVGTYQAVLKGAT